MMLFRSLSATTVADGLPGCDRSHVSAWRERTAAIDAARQPAGSESSLPINDESRALPSCRTNHVTPWMQPLSEPAGVPAPSNSTTASGVAATKSSFWLISLCRNRVEGDKHGLSLSVLIQRREKLNVCRLTSVRIVLDTHEGGKLPSADLPIQACDVGGDEMDHAKCPRRIDTCEDHHQPLPIGARQPSQVGDVPRLCRLRVQPGAIDGAGPSVAKGLGPSAARSNCMAGSWARTL